MNYSSGKRAAFESSSDCELTAYSHAAKFQRKSAAGAVRGFSLSQVKKREIA